jgi:hypothetical protein
LTAEPTSPTAVQSDEISEKPQCPCLTRCELSAPVADCNLYRDKHPERVSWVTATDELHPAATTAASDTQLFD